ncbi:MAG: AraC family transcriptional regulator [Acidobacteriota bacterium]
MSPARVASTRSPGRSTISPALGIVRLWRSESLCLGEFSLPPGDSADYDSSPISGCNVVFPRTRLHLRWSDGSSHWSDPAVINYYNDGDSVERTDLEPAGDRSLWLELRPPLLDALLVRLRPTRSFERPFSLHQAPSVPRAYLAMRRLIDKLAGCGTPSADDALRIDETAMVVLDAALGSFESRRVGSAAPSPSYRARVEASRELLAHRPEDSLSLDAIARTVDASPYHLARAFRAVTGTTLHQYRLRLRLHQGIERLLDGAADISAVAHDLGFSSHSHFTATVRRHLRLTPSQVRALARSPRWHDAPAPLARSG